MAKQNKTKTSSQMSRTGVQETTLFLNIPEASAPFLLFELRTLKQTQVCVRTVNLSRRPSLFPLLLPSSSSFSIPLNKHELRSTRSQAFFLGRGLGAGKPQSLEGERKGTDGQTDSCYLYNVISTVGGNKEQAFRSRDGSSA